MDRKAILLENVSKLYYLGKTKLCALSDINLEVSEGEFLAIQGPSGAGKTTLLNIIAGLDTPTNGKVSVLGTSINESSEDSLSMFRCLNIGFVFQHYNLISTFTAIENVEFPIEISGKDASKAGRKARELLMRVGLADRALHLPGQLSGGEQQRLAFARAVANDPRILLADEPTGNLDVTSEKIIVEILVGLRRKGTTIVAATHDEGVLKLASRTLNLVNGRIIDAR